MKIVILDGYTANPGDLSWDGLRALGDLTVYERTRPEETIARCKGADIVLTNKVVMSREVMEALPALRYIGVLATGYNVVDTEMAKERGIVVTNVPAYSTESVAQMRGTMDAKPGLLLLGRTTDGVGWEDDGRHRIGKYWQSRSSDSAGLRHEGEGNDGQTPRGFAQGCGESHSSRAAFNIRRSIAALSVNGNNTSSDRRGNH